MSKRVCVVIDFKCEILGHHWLWNKYCRPSSSYAGGESRGAQI